MITTLIRILAVLAFMLAAGCGASAQISYPPTKRQPVTDHYFGVRVTDNYRWMENMGDTTIKSWFKQQGELAERTLDQINGRNELLNEMIKLGDIKPATVSGVVLKNNRYFYRKIQSGEKLSRVYFHEGEKGNETLLIDPAGFSKGKRAEIAFFSPSPNGKMVAFGIAEDGVEIATIRIMQVDTRKLYPETLHPSWFGITDWTADNKGFLYNLQQSDQIDKEQMMLDTKVMYHAAGTLQTDDKEIFSGSKYPLLGIKSEDILFVNISNDAKYLLAVLSGVDDNLHTFYAPANELLQPVISWKALTKPSDGITSLILHKNDLYLLSHKNASKYKLLLTDIRQPDFLNAKTIVAEREHKIESISELKDYLLIKYTDGINNTLTKLSLHSRQKQEIKLPVSGTLDVNRLSASSNQALLRITSWKMPPALYALNGVSGKVEISDFHHDAIYPGVEDIVVEEIEVPGHDGVMVPLSIFYNKNVKRDGSAPCIISGYGSYGTTTHPFFSPFLLATVNKGVIAAWAHVRGGGEKGETWHMGGFKQTKPNTWKDFISCAEYLVNSQYTSPQKMAGWGVSAGGILIGRAITERPDLFAAAINEVSISNTLRFENTPNGPNNAKEFGTVKDSAECMALIEMDALHHVKKGIDYPAVLTIAGMNDPRVIPWQPGKFAAALQHASSSGKPALLKVNYNSGHFTEDRLITYKNFADAISFALWQCGHPGFKAVKTNNSQSE